MEQLTRFEKTRILSARALQIAMGAPVLVKADGKKEPRGLAMLEFEKDLLPLTVLRS